MTNLLKNAIDEEMAREIADDLRGGSNEQKAFRVDTDKLKKLFESCKIELDGSTLTFEVPIEYHDNGVVKKSYVLEFDAVEEHAQDDDEAPRKAFFENREAYTSAEFETLYNCIDYIERHGDNKADREKAIKAARCLLFDMEQRLGNVDDALSDVIRAIGGGWVFF